MPIQNREDAVEVEDRVNRIFAATPGSRAGEVRGLFVEVLDFNPALGQASLVGVQAGVSLPDAADRIAELDGVQVLYIAMPSSDTNRVRKAEVDAAAKLLANQLGDDLLLVFTNLSANQLHIILPSFAGSRPTLRRMVVDRDLPRRTAVQQVSNIYWNWQGSGNIHAALEAAFDVEPVTRDFFAEYKRIFEVAETSVSGFQDTAEGREEKRFFVQTLFNRLMFVYFLQRKGWLRFDGDSDYLRSLWQDYGKGLGDGNFHRDRLRPIFFSGLNNPNSRDLTEGLRTFIGDVPFLNGGLFEETDLDRRHGITVPDEAIRQVLTGLFDRFNFTVMESTPFDIEVAVDPEMLGKVFEELVTGRHDSGAYYTPRPVVSFMCSEALKGYLEGQDTGLDTEAIARFVDQHDTEGIGVAQARRVAEALAEVTVVDPACGSGAYLLGMMQELIELQVRLFNVTQDAKSLYDLKLEIIQRNLYGVDIDDFAVNIAMLRLWLSLAIDYEGATPEPLPNLDFKVVCGDSLLGPDPSSGAEVQVALGQDVEQMRRLGDLKGEFMRAKPGPGKDRLRADIESAKAEIRESLGLVGDDGTLNWRVEFAEVFGGGHGFDIAIANPPYVQLQKDAGKLGKLYQGCGYEVFARTGDIYQIFYERGCQMLRPEKGILAYITSNSWLKAEYGKALRRYFFEKQTPLLLLELGKDVFESAIVDSGVLMLRTGGGGQPFPAVDMDRIKTHDVPPAPELWGQAKPSGDAPWSILSRTEHSVLDKMREKGTPLKDWNVNINYGIKTGYNKAFIIDGKTREELIAKDQKSSEIIKPVLRGRDIQRFQAQSPGLWLINVPWHFPLQFDSSIKGASEKAEALFKKQYPAIYQHLLSHKAALSARNKSETGIRYEWYALQRWAANYYGEFTKEKLLWIELVESGRFAYDNTGTFGEATTFLITGTSLKFLCAVLNSSLIRWFLNQIAPTSGMGTLRWKKVYVENIPILKLSAAKQRPFVRLVDRILEAKAADPDADTAPLEWEIDRLVYDLYGLTEEEDTAVKRSLGLIHATDKEEDEALLQAMEEGDINDRVSLEEVLEILRAPDEC